jgi:hypothetical protein
MIGAAAKWQFMPGPRSSAWCHRVAPFFIADLYPSRGAGDDPPSSADPQSLGGGIFLGREDRDGVLNSNGSRRYFMSR